MLQADKSTKVGVPGMGGTLVLLDHSVPGKWDSLREITAWPPEGGWTISPGLPSLSRDSGAPSLDQRQQSCQPQGHGTWAWLVYISAETRGLKTSVSL